MATGDRSARLRAATTVACRMVGNGSSFEFVRMVLVARFGLSSEELAAVIAEAKASGRPEPADNVVDEALALARVLGRCGTDDGATHEVLVRTFGFTSNEAGAVVDAIAAER